MKPGLAVLPLEVWADIFVFPWITREQLAQIVHKFKNRNFAQKLQFRLHDMGKHSLRYLRIFYKPKKKLFNFQLCKSKIPKRRASLAVTNNQLRGVGGVHNRRTYKDCEFPRCEMPENIRAFKQLTIAYLDDQVLNFLHKIKLLFTDVIINMGPIEWEKEKVEDLCILFGHLLPMVAGIRRIRGCNYHLQVLEQKFPGTLARAKELELSYIDPASIPTYLDWLSAPLAFDQHGPRFLKMDRIPLEPIALIDSVRKHFLAATAPSTFAILIELNHPGDRTEEFNLDNAATKEKLTIRNAQFMRPKYGLIYRYVEIMRHPTGTDAKMREWLKQRAYYEKKYKENNEDGEEKQVISMNTWPRLTIGQITNEDGAMGQREDDKSDGNAAGQSSSSAKKTCVIS